MVVGGKGGAQLVRRDIEVSRPRGRGEGVVGGGDGEAQWGRGRGAGIDAPHSSDEGQAREQLQGDRGADHLGEVGRQYGDLQGKG